jgi:RNA polymerase sigma factor (sigma-70 family)
MSSDPREIRFRRLYEEHYEMLLAYAARRCPDPSEARDIVADTFLVLWRRLEAAPDDKEVPLWLHGVIRRVLANHYRGRMRRDRLAARFAQTAREAPETDELAETNMHARQVLNALMALSEQQREVLLLAAWEQLSTVEIAAVLGCSENAAALRLHRARKRLTEVYKKENERTGDKSSEWPRLRRPPPERQDR